MFPSWCQLGLVTVSCSIMGHAVWDMGGSCVNDTNLSSVLSCLFKLMQSDYNNVKKIGSGTASRAFFGGVTEKVELCQEANPAYGLPPCKVLSISLEPRGVSAFP
ncbi:hypothetical protein llap_14764 [Limosa lapponica baueri]|uniref:Rna-directed dna polymerase from mobile element jockey-like n=1 Tax=Limosa lapponica baueri TaxID=1758121 RepID=A0A2I0TMC4_LIMLA|nr:hypothetical protein llap_14764 [Limosa lapponica baueri]